VELLGPYTNLALASSNIDVGFGQKKIPDATNHVAEYAGLVRAFASIAPLYLDFYISKRNNSTYQRFFYFNLLKDLITDPSL